MGLQKLLAQANRAVRDGVIRSWGKSALGGQHCHSLALLQSLSWQTGSSLNKSWSLQLVCPHLSLMKSLTVLTGGEDMEVKRDTFTFVSLSRTWQGVHYMDPLPELPTAHLAHSLLESTQLILLCPSASSFQCCVAAASLTLLAFGTLVFNFNPFILLGFGKKGKEACI